MTVIRYDNVVMLGINNLRIFCSLFVITMIVIIEFDCGYSLY